jgi:hypothetical protein
MYILRYYVFSYYFLLFFCWDWGFAFRALHLQSRLSTAGAMSSTHFALAVLEMGHANYLLGLAWNSVLPILASQADRNTGMSHQCPASLRYYEMSFMLYSGKDLLK